MKLENNYRMFKNYFKTALRNLWKDKVSAIINHAGLAAGMACCMLILMYIKHELSYNTFNTNLKNIYNVNWITRNAGQTTVDATAPIAFSPVIAPKIPAIQYAARTYQRPGEMQPANASGADTKRFQELNVYFADASLFNIFSIQFVKGSAGASIQSPNTVVVTDEMAAKYFGTQNPIGKTLLYENKQPLLVTGVVKKMPDNSDIQFDFLVSFDNLFTVETKGVADFLKRDWTFNPAYTFFLLKPGANIAGVNQQLNALLKQNGNDRNRQLNNVVLQPLEKMHLYAPDVIGNPSTNSITYIYIFAGIALLILFIANVNFINLAVARAVSRAREVGMRKVMGAAKWQLVIQFTGETLLISLAAFIIAFSLAAAALPVLNQLTNKQLPLQTLFSVQNCLLFGGVFFITAVLAGLYPAFFITRFKPAIAIKGKSGETRQRNTVRKALLVAQFAISIMLIIGAAVIYQQLQYMRNKPLGFTKTQMMVVPIFGSGPTSALSSGVDGPLRQRMNTFVTELLRNSNIKAATAASAMPGQGFVLGLVVPQGYTEKNNIFVPWVSVDYNFLQALNVPIVAGRGFSKAAGSDHLSAFILNESAVRSFGWKSPQDAIGKTMIRGDEAHGKKGQVIGVIKDFDFNTLDQPMQPLILDVNTPRFTQFAINVQNQHLPATIEYVRQTWNKMFPERVFEYSFLDKDIDKLYNDKENLSHIIEYFALAAILLSCCGLYCLASYLAVQRTKEIGIRKVLGANVATIFALLSGYFVRLVVIAFVIALPVAWFVMGKWLQGFAYRINISWWVFAGAGLAVMVMALATVSYQAVRAALANPVNSLRAE